MNKQRLHGIIIIALLLSSNVFFISTLTLQQSFAAVSIYEVNNDIFINATGISASGEGTESKILKLTIKKTVDSEGNMHTTAYNATEDMDDGAFSPYTSQQYLAFSDITENLRSQSLTKSVGQHQLVISADTDRWIGQQYANGTVIAANARGFMDAMGGAPASAIGASVQQKTVVFESPTYYANEFCNANGYSFLNVINSTYSRNINYPALNSFRSEFLGETMMIYNASTYQDKNETIQGSAIYQQDGGATAFAVTIIAIVAILGLNVLGQRLGWWAEGSFYGIGGHGPTAPLLLNVSDPSDASDDIANVTQAAIDFWSNYVDQAWDAYNNGTITFDQLTVILAMAGQSVNDLVSNATVSILGLWNRYYNTSEDIYDTYAGLYELYAAAFEVKWTDWLTTMMILACIIIGLIVVYKIVSRKKSVDAGVPVIINT